MTHLLATDFDSTLQAGWQRFTSDRPHPEGSVETLDAGGQVRSPGNGIPRLKWTKSAEADCKRSIGVPFKGPFRDSAEEFIPRSPLG